MSNNVNVSGKVKEYFLSHKLNGESFYSVIIENKRLSGVVDIIPLIVSNKIYKFSDNEIGEFINVTGELRTYNLKMETKNKLILNVFVNEINFINYEDNMNEIVVEGFICKNPTYRTTPKGRKIADLIIASNRYYGKSDYLPCIAWGKNAIYVSSLSVGNNISILGRLQSREYIKDDVVHIAFEVSIQNIIMKQLII